MALLAEPLNLALVALVVGALLVGRRRTVGRSLWVVAALLCYGLATPVVSTALLQFLEGQVVVDGSRTGTAQAIVILGGDLAPQSRGYEGDTVGRLSLERIRYGARLHRESGLPILVAGGRIGGSSLPVSEAMKRALEVDFGVPVAWVEPQSRNTFENATFSAELLRSSHIETVYLVTHTWHLIRALEAFDHAGLRAIPKGMGTSSKSPGFQWRDLIPRSTSLTASTFALHEVLGRIWYLIIYY